MNKSAKYFCSKQNQEFIDDEGNFRCEADSKGILAKALPERKTKSMTDRTLHYNYYIMCNPQLKPFNPVVKHTIEKQNENSYIDATCKGDWSLKKVNIHVFNTYIEFLRTENTRLLRIVEQKIA